MVQTKGHLGRDVSLGQTDMGLFTYYVTQGRWVGGLQNVTLLIELKKFYYAKALLEVGGWSKYQKNCVT